MENGANGNLGMTVQDPVAVEFKHALARALTQAPLMEVELVLGVVAMPNLVGQMLVQVISKTDKIKFLKPSALVNNLFMQLTINHKRSL